jgi:sugar transferase EpsL
MDFACAFTALVLLSPVLGVIALTVKKKLGSPVVFRQIRPGLHGRLRRHRSRDFTDGRIESAFWEDGI